MQVVQFVEPTVVITMTPAEARQLQSALRVASEEYIEMVAMAKDAELSESDVAKFRAWVDSTGDLWVKLEEALG